MPKAKKNKTNLDLEKNLFSKGANLVAGMDEVGRGCLSEVLLLILKENRGDGLLVGV